MISVIIACRNGAATLGETLKGLVGQEAVFDWEIVFADNGSTDGSRAIFEDYARRNPKVWMRVVDASAGRGKPEALNLAIRSARGDRLLFCDADDVVAAGWLSAMARALDRHDLVAARFEYTRLNSPEVRAGRHGRDDVQKELMTVPFAPWCTHAGGATLGFHRRVFDDVGDFDPRFRTHEDMQWCIRAHFKGYRIFFVPDALYHYRFRDDPEAARQQARQYAADTSLLRKLYGGPTLTGPAAAMAWASLHYNIAALKAWELLAKLGFEVGRASVSKHVWGLAYLGGELAAARSLGIAPAYRGFGRLERAFKRTKLAVAGLFHPTLFAVRTKVQAMALTFDDGPDPKTTPVLLDLLARLGVKATFFVVGARVEQHPELVARIAAEGHEIGNHSWDHPSLSGLPGAEVEDQLIRTREALRGHCGVLMRPPFGDASLAVNAMARRLGYKIVIWDVVGRDWYDDDSDAIAQRVLKQAHPGAIVLLHDTLYHYHAEEYGDRAPVFAAIERVIQSLPGWRFVTVSELMALGQPVTGGWIKASTARELAGLHCAEKEDGLRRTSPPTPHPLGSTPMEHPMSIGA
ncbi:polysaccharide deacetylase family protein [Rubrimonas sp.]|uniref:polysaccharide deacetylase family protein n=1 Tax=Rubrimonas sp. TaxID=2036015 RepID=UPI002FDC983E